MTRQLDECQLIERSLNKRFRKELWTPFIAAVKRYALISEGDRVAVCISGDSASTLMAKLIQQLNRHSDVPFEAVYLAADPGWTPEERRHFMDCVDRLRIPVHVAGTEAEGSDTRTGANLTARLCHEARALGCNKLALGRHFNDVIETTVQSMLGGTQLRGMLPKRHIEGVPGLSVILPMYCVHRDDIDAWVRYNRLDLLNPAPNAGRGGFDRESVRTLLRQLKRENPDIEKSIFNSVHAVSLDTFPGWRFRGGTHSFLEWYDK